jgi:hypothetical protein
MEPCLLLLLLLLQTDEEKKRLTGAGLLVVDTVVPGPLDVHASL